VVLLCSSSEKSHSKHVTREAILNYFNLHIHDINWEGKFALVHHAINMHLGVEVWLPTFLTSALDGSGCKIDSSAALPPGETPPLSIK
jgi:hypothetical protein